MIQRVICLLLPLLFPGAVEAFSPHFSTLSKAPSNSLSSIISSSNSRIFLSNGNLNQPFTQVISDVDDTLKSSGGVNVAGVALGGIDVQYARGDLYPGVFQFMLEMSAYKLPSKPKTSSDEDPTPFQPARVAVLTARAEEFKAALELKPTSKLAMAFRKTGEKSGYDDWGLGPVLYGSVSEWVVQVRKGLRKFSNFERLLQQDPTNGKMLQYVYVGDTGELDQEAGEQMLRFYPELVKAVFLHAVSGEVWDGDNYLPIPPAKLINGRPLVFFRTYVGAAAAATQLGLMGEDGLLRVIKAAEDALTERGVRKQSDKWRDLERDIANALRTISSPIESEQFQGA